jgi:hypothetical protein
MNIEIKRRPLEGDLYAALLRSAGNVSFTIGMVIRSDKVALWPRATSLLAALEPYALRIEQVTEWPGTQLIGGRTSRRHLFRLTTDSIDLVLAASTTIFDWINPGLPEDLHLLRRDGSTVLGSIAQENAVWLEVDGDELDRMLATASAELHGVLTHAS